MKTIDLNRLEMEWVEHPERYRKAALKVADAADELKTAEGQLELVSAEIEHDIRIDPESYGITKISEAWVKSTIIRQKPYREALKDKNDKKHKLEILKVAVGEIDREKSAIEDEVKLWIAGYFSTPYIDNEKWMEKTEKDKMNKAFGNKRKREE